MADEPEVTDEAMQLTKEKLAVIDAWCKRLLIHAGVKVVNVRNAGGDTDAYGLLNVPAKYVGIFDAMHQGMSALALGQPLPEFTPLPEKSVKRAKKRR